jgi:hypothetical protein
MEGAKARKVAFREKPKTLISALPHNTRSVSRLSPCRLCLRKRQTADITRGRLWARKRLMHCNMTANRKTASRRSLRNLLGPRLRRVSRGRSSGPLERLLSRLIGAIERSAGFRQSSHQCGPRLLPRLVHLLVLFLRRGSIGFHVLHGGLYFAPTLAANSLPAVRRLSAASRHAVTCAAA